MTNLSPHNIPLTFREFAFMPNFDADIETLASIAESEDWDYRTATSKKSHPVLRNYIEYTYRKVAEEKKIVVTSDEKYACWNTGLVTEHQEPIFIIFNENKLVGRTMFWHFWRFLRRGEASLNRFGTLPEMVNYFNDPTILVYNPNHDLRVNYEHIIADNRHRFPDVLKTMNDFALQNILKGAVDSALERVRRNYKTAVPQYYEGRVQLLLPLCLVDAGHADLALIIDRVEGCVDDRDKAFYRASTCLPLDWAYNNARQLARPDRDWLAP